MIKFDARRKTEAPRKNKRNPVLVSKRTLTERLLEASARGLAANFLKQSKQITNSVDLS